MDPNQPSIFNYVLSFLLVGVAWGFTTPFIRRAAADFNARQEAKQPQPQPNTSGSNAQELQPGGRSDETDDSDPPQAPTPAWMKPHPSFSSALKTRIISLFWTVVNLLRTPAYSVPLVINLTGSIWFFLLVGKHELSMTVPLANSSAFLFTVLGEWYVERKVIAKGTWLGMALVLAGIGVCVQSKNM